jgi:hypothetical protein
MKFLALVSALLIGKSVAQTGYSVGGTGSVTLPQGPTGGSGSSTGSGSGSVNVVVPTFPSADLSRLNLSGVSTTSVIVEGKNELSTPVRSIPSLFTRFPSSS